MKECDEIREVLKLFELSTNALDHIDDGIRMSEHALLVMQLDNQRLTKENLELTAKLAAPRSSSYKGMQTELRVAIHNLEGTNAALRQENLDMRETLNMNPRSVYLSHVEHPKSIGVLNAKIKELEADRELLQKRLRSTKRCLTSERLKAMGLEEQIDKFKAREIVGQMWESELREVLGIAGPHTKGVKIIDTVKSILAAKSWQHYEPEIRKMERERVFRKLTTLRDLASSGFLGLWKHDKNYQIKYTEQQMSDFLGEGV